MRNTTLQMVNFKVERQGDMVMLTFVDFINIGGQRVAVEAFTIPFDEEAWPKFQRRVATEGAGAGIELARAIPSL